jgi:hypothetical protein
MGIAAGSIEAFMDGHRPFVSNKGEKKGPYRPETGAVGQINNLRGEAVKSASVFITSVFYTVS